MRTRRMGGGRSSFYSPFPKFMSFYPGSPFLKVKANRPTFTVSVGAPAVSIAISSPTQNEQKDDIVFQVTGTSAPGVTVQLYDDSDVLIPTAAITANGGGNWSAWVGFPNAVPPYVFYAKDMTNSVVSSNRTFTILSATGTGPIDTFVWGVTGTFDSDGTFSFQGVDTSDYDGSGGNYYSLVVRKSGTPTTFFLYQNFFPVTADGGLTWQAGSITKRSAGGSFANGDTVVIELVYFPA